ncbi:hypothetical protein OHT68_00305 [Streptomyces canus]|uniref:RHS repeat-associated core domain-containing protein n=1 Tax=Streptomyces canus TaxID=58343 RepID=UPI002E281F93|nr:RHS repeat-associated core domain-containing protein [Streptomyces canus]
MAAGTRTPVLTQAIPAPSRPGTNYGFELAADQHGTNSLYLDNTAQTPTWRQFDPYGSPGGTTTWADNRTFLNKATDTTTGLTDIGAREYGPTLGRFISLDPLLQTGISQSLNGYSYGADNPHERDSRATSRLSPRNRPRGAGRGRRPCTGC